jgi:ribosomal protein L11 methyltransferase
MNMASVAISGKLSHAKEKPSGWYALDVDIDGAAHEAVEYALMEAGALGTETTDRGVTAYFAETPSRELVRNELFEALRIYDLPSSSVRDMNLREVKDRDWLEEWKQSWQPVEIGRLIIAPPWSDLGEVHDRLVIRIEPGMAFGTGTHETTRLCLDAIQKHFAGGSFLDVGTGTGILAIAAAKLFPEAHIEGCDTDETAIVIARENAELNDVAEQINFWTGSIDDSTASADLVVANLTADVITSIMPALVGVACGKLILSGILETQLEMVQASLHGSGIDEFEITQDGEWIALIV